jgi:hypothetical protein
MLDLLYVALFAVVAMNVMAVVIAEKRGRGNRSDKISGIFENLENACNVLLTVRGSRSTVRSPSYPHDETALRRLKSQL